MTAIKSRPPGTFAEAVTRVMDTLTADGAGGVIGKSGQRIRCAADPDQSNYSPLSLPQALELDVAMHRATGKEGPMLWAYRHLYAFRTSHNPRPIPIVERIGLIAKEFGEVIDSLSQACHPNGHSGVEVTPAEALACSKEIDGLLRNLEEARADIRRRAGIDPETLPTNQTHAA